MILSRTRAHNLSRLRRELETAIPDLAPVVDPELLDPLTGTLGAKRANLLMSSQGDELTLTVPDNIDVNAIDAVLAPHDPTPDPLPIVYGEHRTVENKATTVGVAPVELFRQALAQKTAYTATVDLVGVDRGNGAMRFIRATIAVKRLTGNAILVPIVGGGLAQVLADHRDTAAATWTIVPSVNGSDFIITCTGAGGRTVDWFCRLQVDSFTPEGIA